MIDEKQVRMAFDALHYMVGDVPVVHYFVKGAGMVGGGTAASGDMLVSLMHRYEGKDCYILLNPAVGFYGTKAAAKDITHLSWILVDIDPKLDDATPGEACFVARNAIERVVGTSPACLPVYSGRGWQLWVPLAEPLPMRPEYDSMVKGFVKHIADQIDSRYGCVVDTSCAEVSRVARMPGTRNTKTGRLAKMLPPEDTIEGLTLNMLRQFSMPETAPTLRLPEQPNLSQIITRLNNTATEFLLLGTTHTSSVSRHNAMYATARQLHEMGLGVDTARGMLLVGASICRPPLAPEEAERVIRQVYQKG